MIGYAQFSKVKDHYCICYFGHADEYLIQLRLLQKKMEREFKGLNIFFGCKDDKVHLLEGCPGVLKISQIKERKHEFAHIKEIKSDGRTHPIEELLVESGMTNLFVTDKAEATTNKCVIVTRSVLPTGNLGTQEINDLERTARAKGFSVSFDSGIEGAGWVVGVESPQIFEAAGRGVRTTLVPTGVGTRLYKAMFPNGVVLHR